MYRFFFKHFVKIKRVDSFKRFLFIGPHPDDIELGCGALVGMLTGKKDVSICFLVCTDGRFGNSQYSDGNMPTEENLALIRKTELFASANLLGVKEIKTLNYSDGSFYEDTDIIISIARIIEEFKPEVVFVTDPDVYSECNEDHVRIGRIVKKLFSIFSNRKIMEKYGSNKIDIKELAFYFTSRPNQKIISGKKFFKKKINALLEHSSQFPKDSDITKKLITYLKIKRFIFRKEESFRVLDKTHSHCFPEADF